MTDSSTEVALDAQAEEPLPHRKPPLRFAGAALLVSLGAAAFAIAFRGALSLALHGLAHSSDVVAAMKHMPIWVRLALPAIGGLVAGTLGLLGARLRDMASPT